MRILPKKVGNINVNMIKRTRLKNWDLPWISFSGELPQELVDDMLCCNNAMMIIIQMFVELPLKVSFHRVNSKMFPVK